jgi:hypothetical protein
MASYIWDLGFDFNHLRKPDGNHDLQIGLVKYDSTQNKYLPASPITMGSNDTVKFSLYDLTMGAEKDKWEKTIIHAALVEFSPAMEGSRGTPFGDEEQVLIPKLDFSGNSGVSAYFGGTYPVYHWDKAFSINPSASQHHCEMTVTVIVTKKKKNEAKYETRKFVVDPEMIIDSNGR